MHTQKYNYDNNFNSYTDLENYKQWASNRGLRIIVEFEESHGWSCCFCIDTECVGHSYGDALNTSIYEAYAQAKKDPRLA